MTNSIWVKNVEIGGSSKISIQSMTDTDTKNIDATINQINTLFEKGCDIVRVSTPTLDDVKALKKIISLTDVPIVADIHYNSSIAIAAIEAGAHKIRINPLNFPKKDIKCVLACAKDHGIPIRIGFNTGGFKKHVTTSEYVEEVLKYVSFFEQNQFTDIIISLKSSDVLFTIDSYKYLARHVNYPLHVGLTEAGPAFTGTIKSTVAISNLLLSGIGNTIRVSLSDSPLEEVKVAKILLSSIGLYDKSVNVISCPMCARANIDVHSLATTIEDKVLDITDEQQISIALMGCPVNGIGESQNSTIGICGGKNKSQLYIKGNFVGIIPNNMIKTTVLEYVNKLCDKGIE